jgi:hypothetical protein
MAAILKAKKVKAMRLGKSCEAPNVLSCRVREEISNERRGVRWKSIGSRTRRE